MWKEDVNMVYSSISLTLTHTHTHTQLGMGEKVM
jgi:hypothetical protein